jgi:putative PIN family toxin of toxin-antitoxin system
MSQPLVAVVDASVWISGIFFRRGIPADILRAWRDGRFDVVVTSATLGELERKLADKSIQFGSAPSLAKEWIEYIRAYAHVAPTSETAHGVCRDPDDDKFLDAAVEGGAHYIVSGDKDLQVLSSYCGVQIVPPRRFAELLGIVSHEH